MTVEARRSLSLTRTVSNGIECSAVLSIGLMELNLGQGRGNANARMTQSRKTPDKCMPDLINMAMISKIDNDDIEDPSQLQYVKDQHMHLLRLNGMYKPHVRYDFWFCRNGATNPIRYPNRPPSSPFGFFLYRCKGAK
ncbi:hypothetical protein CFAM422_011741 [Trichoderma lentiforme]|uniref:Uncharacterized protein n=1 Tax=Trichoderma lentiforme TaxID=1567552 RepID=A0A9P4X592_9HYPO|nr:hypothetical protein CFAM422_011741 [Trichoderma lentiforme]